MEVHFDINLTESQKEVLQLLNNKQKRYICLAWSRQSGKSTLMKILCIKWALNNVRGRCIGYVCRNYMLAKKFYKELVQSLPSAIVRSANASELTIEFHNHSTIQFFSAESGNALRGQTFDYLILDEFAFFKLEQTDGTNLWYDILSPTLKVKGKRCIFVSTPLGKNNLFYELYVKGLDTRLHNKYASIKKDIYSDGLISEEEIEEIKKNVPELTFRQEYLCEFLDSGNSFFNGFEECFEDIEDVKYQRTWIGVDLSGDGTDATIVTKINEKNEVEQFEIGGTLDMKYNEIAYIINNSKNLQGVYLEKNGLGSPMINEIRKLVREKSKLREWTTTNSSKEEINTKLAVAIAKKEIHIPSVNRELYSQFATFVANYTKSGKLQLNATCGNHDDRVMSLAIAFKCKDDIQYQRVSEKYTEIKHRNVYIR